jgi:hypothetical protein
MNLESDKRLNIQLRLDFSSTPTGEARQTGREDTESLSAVSDPERLSNTRRIILSKRVSVTSRTAVYGPYVRWCGRGGAARLPPIPIAATSCCGTSRTWRCVRVESVIKSGILDPMSLGPFSALRRCDLHLMPKMRLHHANPGQHRIAVMLRDQHAPVGRPADGFRAEPL